ncbi:hypothetical protein DPMN_019741 [Dreissena polymorpha]|uniref:Uncharacterized protein n=1 Tax=Dreissena polymorpha TaxID=45954 RepID=A0A9D4S8G6_DREPO|nr:hypothetical protein DPMN_019741 [Dreissena polymorpha]
MVRKARDTGGPLVPYETASTQAAFRDPGRERRSARPGTREAPSRKTKSQISGRRLRENSRKFSPNRNRSKISMSK